MQVCDTFPCTTVLEGRMGGLQGFKNLFIINLLFTDTVWQVSDSNLSVYLHSQ